MLAERGGQTAIERLAKHVIDVQINARGIARRQVRRNQRQWHGVEIADQIPAIAAAEARQDQIAASAPPIEAWPGAAATGSLSVADFDMLVCGEIEVCATARGARQGRNRSTL